MYRFLTFKKEARKQQQHTHTQEKREQKKIIRNDGKTVRVEKLDAKKEIRPFRDVTIRAWT